MSVYDNAYMKYLNNACDTHSAKYISDDYYFPNEDITEEEAEERELRKTNNTVKDAWEQYQVVLRLARK